MKLNNLKLYICCLGTALLLGSCNKYIDLKPENNTYDEVFWKDADNISKAVAGSYSMFRDAIREDRAYFTFGDLAAGNFTVGSDYWNFNDLSKKGSFEFSYAPYLEGSYWNWTRFYQIVNQCNLIIENTPEISVDLFEGGEETRNALIAEARFIRALTNFYMQRVWGDILLIKESYKDPQNVPPIARSPQEETLAFCIEDLEYAIANLNNSGSKAKASKGAAQALLAHVYAWKHDYVNAEKIATEVINSSYSLESMADYRKIWAGGSKESIFELNMLYGESGAEFSQTFFSAFLMDPVVKGKSANSAWTIDTEVLEIYFEDEEARFDSISRPGTGSNQFFLRKYDNVKYYQVNDPGVYAVSNNLVVFRLADLYLLRAESYFKNGKTQQALDDLNLIRNRAGLASVNTSGNELFEEIFKERRRELIGEGSAQFDAIRMEFLNKLEYSNYYTESRIANQGYYWPIHMRDLLPQNELLTQNPWWKNH